MKMSIKQMQEFIEVYNKTKNKNLEKDFSCLFNIVKTIVLSQTNLDSIESVEKVIRLYNSYKRTDWFKSGLEQVLLNGSFPERIVTSDFPYTTRQIPFDPTPFPSPIWTYTTYAANGSVNIDELLDKLKKSV